MEGWKSWPNREATTTDLAAQRSDFIGHLHWVGEILLIEALLYTVYVVQTDVIPAALVPKAQWVTAPYQ